MFSLNTAAGASRSMMIFKYGLLEKLERGRDCILGMNARINAEEERLKNYSNTDTYRHSFWS